jgi:hypothetical protein
LFLFFNKIVIKAEQDLPRSEGERRRVERGAEEEMTQTMHAHVNK